MGETACGTAEKSSESDRCLSSRKLRHKPTNRMPRGTADCAFNGKNGDHDHGQSDKISPNYGVSSIMGGRKEMEDAVSVHPCWFGEGWQFFGVYDGHGCSHAAARCKERMHELLREELGTTNPNDVDWNAAMAKCFYRMDEEIIAWNEGGKISEKCRCELQSPKRDAVGTTAVVAVVSKDKIIVANCGDSRAVLCRNGRPIPLSLDHKPDRPDELTRIQEAGGRVIYWNGPRLFGVLAMSRALGDGYLKPYVICEPEVTVMDRDSSDECLILAPDGLWDVVPNETVCKVARTCIKKATGTPNASANGCQIASLLLTKLSMAKHSTDNISVVIVDVSCRS